MYELKHDARRTGGRSAWGAGAARAWCRVESACRTSAVGLSGREDSLPPVYTAQLTGHSERPTTPRAPVSPRSTGMPSTRRTRTLSDTSVAPNSSPSDDMLLLLMAALKHLMRTSHHQSATRM